MEKKQPSVSIFILTYMGSEERGPVLKRTVEVALMQNYPDFEVVVSDNAGPYPASEALKEINDPRLRIVANEENAGFTGNANRCVDLCKNDIIKLLCDDDLIHPDFLINTVPLVDDRTLVVVDVAKFEIGKEPAAMKQRVESVESERRKGGYGADMWYLKYTPSSIPSATLLTKTLFREMGGFDKNTITSDWDFFIECALYRDIVHVKTPLCFVGVWPGSLTEEMLVKPFFYPTQGLYTKIRVYRTKRLQPAQRRSLLFQILKGYFMQSLRPVKQPHKKAYRAGYSDYSKRFWSLLLGGKENFGPRPN